MLLHRLRNLVNDLLAPTGFEVRRRDPEAEIAGEPASASDLHI